MGVKIFSTELQEIAKEKTLRADADFMDFQNNFLIEKYYPFSSLFDFTSNKINYEDLEEDFYYAEIGNVSKEGSVDPVKLNFNIRAIEEENYYKKIEKGDIIQASDNDILISKVRPNLKKIIYIDNSNKDYYYTSAFIHITPKKLNKILFYSLRSIFFQNILAISRQGKGYPTLKEDDFNYLKFDKQIVDKLLNKQKELNEEISKIENRILNLATKSKQTTDIINEVFARDFGFDLKTFEELKRIKDFYLDISDAAKNKDLRNSVAFHQEAARFVMSELRRISKSKIKHFIAEPIALGASISPADFDENGDYYYVSMATVKSYSLELDDTQLVSESYAEQNLNKAIKKHDIIMTRSGVAIGKFALVEDDVQAIYADFTMRIRLKNYNPHFAYYYFRTDYFQHLIHTNKKGLQNKNIFPGQIQELPIIDIPLNQQQKIVDEIKEELDKQEEIKQQIAAERAKIDSIIEKAVA